MPTNVKESKAKTNSLAIGGTIRETIEVILYGSVRSSKPINYSSILKKVEEEHPEANTTKKSIDYYVWRLRQQGHKVNVARSK